MRRLAGIIFIAVLVAAAAGCGATSPVRITQRPEVIEMANGGGLPRFEYSIAVSPPVLQLVTLRQILYIHLSHPDYIGPSYGTAQREALYGFGDRAYLLDLMDLLQIEERAKSQPFR